MTTPLQKALLAAAISATLFFLAGTAALVYREYPVVSAWINPPLPPSGPRDGVPLARYNPDPYGPCWGIPEGYCYDPQHRVRR